MSEHIAAITERLQEKAVLKQEVYQTTRAHFQTIKRILRETARGLSERMDEHPDVVIDYNDKNEFEVQLTFGGDTLIFSMHTNVFSFEQGYFIHELDYVKEDPDRSYCGMIEVYNFLADSFKYHRVRDMGYMAARIFINKDDHFFVEGQDQLGFLFKEFDKMVLNEEALSHLIEQAVLFSIGFDLWAPKYQDVREVSVGQKMQQSIFYNHSTGKRVGFDFLSRDDEPTA